jgi:hypothetical protein
MVWNDSDSSAYCNNMSCKVDGLERHDTNHAWRPKSVQKVRHNLCTFWPEPPSLCSMSLRGESTKVYANYALAAEKSGS